MQTTSNNSYEFRVPDFVSGALLVDIVYRAKLIAAKRMIIERSDVGLSVDDLDQALRGVLDESKDSLAQSRLSEVAEGSEMIYAVDIVYAEYEDTPWNEVRRYS